MQAFGCAHLGAINAKGFAMTPEGNARLISDEGKQRFGYIDTVGKMTVGIGRNLTDKGLSDQEIMFLYSNDVTECTNDLHDNYSWFPKLTAVRQDVCINMRFNLGAGGFAEFKQMHAALAGADFATAAVQLWNSQAARLLPNRYRRLYWAMLTGSWQGEAWEANGMQWPGDIGAGPVATGIVGSFAGA